MRLKTTSEKNRVRVTICNVKAGELNQSGPSYSFTLYETTFSDVKRVILDAVHNELR